MDRLSREYGREWVGNHSLLGRAKHRRVPRHLRLFGLGTGMFGTPRVTIISRTYPENDGTALGLTFAAGSVGAALLPIAAAAISLLVGWRASFGVMLPLFALLMVGMVYIVPKDSDSSAVDELSLHAVRRIKTALVQRPVLLVGGGMTIVVFSFQGLTAFLPVYLISVKELAQSTADLLYGLFFATGAVIQPIAGYMPTSTVTAMHSLQSRVCTRWGCSPPLRDSTGISHGLGCRPRDALGNWPNQQWVPRRVHPRRV